MTITKRLLAVLLAVVFVAAACGSDGDESSDAPAAPLVQVDRDDVVIETVKRAEDGNGLIVRMYESRRMRGPVRVTAGVPLAAAQRVNLLEETQAELTVDGNSVTYNIRPFEIVTLRLVPA